jgi:hypothetical protein
MDRVALGFIVPMAAAIIAIMLIVGIGTLLLEISEAYGEAIAVAVALALGGAVLVGCTLAALRRPREPARLH